MQKPDPIIWAFRVKQAIPFLVLTLFVMALLWPLLLGRTLYWGDILFYFEPMAAFAGTALREGQLPLWNPHLNLGQPFIGNPQMSIFYPVSILLPVLPALTYLNFVCGFHLWLCGLFTYLFLRRWTSRRDAALVGACVYMGSACLLGRLQFPPMIQTAAYFPALLWRLDRFIDSRTMTNGLWLAVTVSLTVLAAHAQFGYLIMLCGLVYGVCRIVRLTDADMPMQQRRHMFLQACGSPLRYGLLGVCLSAVQILPAMQLLRLSSRAHLDPMQANRFALEPLHLWTLIAPRFLGHPASGDYWGNKTAWEPALFVGWIPLLLIGYVVWRSREKAIVRFWIVMALLGVWMAFGVWGGLFWLAYTLFPGFSHFHDPARFLLWTNFAFAVLAAVGWDRLTAHQRMGTTGKAVLLAGILAPLWWYGQDWNPTTKPAYLDHASASAAQLRGKVGNASPVARRLYMPHNSQPWNRYVTQGYSDYGESSQRALATLQDTLLPNLSMRVGLGVVPAYEPVPVEAVTDLDALARAAWRLGQPNFSQLVSLFNAPLVVVPPTDRYLLPEYTALKPSRGVQAFRRLEPSIHAWLTRRVRRVEGRKRVQAAVSDQDFDPRRETIVSGLDTESHQSLTAMLAPAEDRDDSTGREVRIVAYAPHRVVMEADAGARAAFLVFSAAAYPGWHVQRGEESIRPLRANGGLMGIPLGRGKHSLTWEYIPGVVKVGMYVSLFSLGCISGGFIFCLSRPRQELP